jgi:hypothetical protein
MKSQTNTTNQPRSPPQLTNHKLTSFIDNHSNPLTHSNYRRTRSQTHGHHCRTKSQTHKPTNPFTATKSTHPPNPNQQQISHNFIHWHPFLPSPTKPKPIHLPTKVEALNRRSICQRGEVKIRQSEVKILSVSVG